MQCVGVNLDRLTLLDEERDSLRRIELTVLDIVELREDKNEICRRDVDLGVLVPVERVQVGFLLRGLRSLFSPIVLCGELRIVTRLGYRYYIRRTLHLVYPLYTYGLQHFHLHLQLRLLL